MISFAHLQQMLNMSITRAALILGRNYSTYWPKAGGYDPNERDLTTAMAMALNEGAFMTFTEVPLLRGRSSSTEQRIDLMALDSERQIALIIESKNIEVRKQRDQVFDDFKKMRKFHPVSNAREGCKFPTKVVRMELMMGWTGPEYPDNPYDKPSYQQLVSRLSDGRTEFFCGKALIRDRGTDILDLQYRFQWMLFVGELASLS